MITTMISSWRTYTTTTRMWHFECEWVCRLMLCISVKVNNMERNDDPSRTSSYDFKWNINKYLHVFAYLQRSANRREKNSRNWVFKDYTRNRVGETANITISRFSYDWKAILFALFSCFNRIEALLSFYIQFCRYMMCVLYTFGGPSFLFSKIQGVWYLYFV